MEVGLIRQIDIDEEMQQSYLDYAMSVIVSRALPDARDGLKPVHRRILHAMHSMGVRSDTAYKKSARIVGEVLGKYHPHGDMAVYEAMARMAQDFSMRYPLIEGQGNFGSVDGDPPAAMRYTEARMATLATEMMADLEKDTVDFNDNFDGSLLEPTVLPAGLPNLLVNGATGIAVGMSTSIPPHNMGEVCEALQFMLENWSRLDDIRIDELMTFIPGPDFPTGGIIVRQKGEADSLAAAYGSGRGKIIVQAKAHIEDMGRGRSRIIVSELPFQINKSSLIEKIADLARSGHLEGLSDLRDESDRQGMRIVLELSKTADPEKVLENLYKRTPLQVTFSLIVLALVEGEPRLLSLKQALRVFLQHRLEVVRRRGQFELIRAQDREHILAGLRIALKDLDAVIQMIRTAKDANQAEVRLQRRLKLSELQAKAILDLPLRRLSTLERKKIDKEHKFVRARIKELESLLKSDKNLRGLISEELAILKSRFGDRRRTQIFLADKAQLPTLLTASDLAPDKDIWVVVSRDNLIFRTLTARLPRLSGRSAPTLVIGANTRDNLYLFSKDGSGVSIPIHTLPESNNPDHGRPVAGATPLGPGREPVCGIALPSSHPGQPGNKGYLLFATIKGMVKRTEIAFLPGPSAKPFDAIRIAESDSLGWVSFSNGNADVVLTTNMGSAIRFPDAEIRAMGLSAAGVLGIKLDGKEARVVGVGTTSKGEDLFLITEDGRAKRSALNKFPRQGRYGKGVRAWQSEPDLRLAGAVIGSERATVHLARGYPRSVRLIDAPRRARPAGGKKLIEVEEGNRVIRIIPAVPRPNFIVPERPPKTTKKQTRSTNPKKKSRPTLSKKNSGGKKSTSKSKLKTGKKK